MTDIEQKRIDAICEAAHIDDINDLSDGYHTFRQLYYQRMMLFAALVKQNRDKAWKSLRHEDGELCFGGDWFIVGIDTPEGSYTYHYEANYFSLFDCVELERGKHWDGHTEKDVTRLLSLEPQPCGDVATFKEDVLDAISRIGLQKSDTKEVQAVAECLRAVEALSPGTAESKTGHWIAHSDGIWIKYYECSKCGKVHDTQSDYCEKCGIKMQKSENKG